MSLVLAPRPLAAERGLCGSEPWVEGRGVSQLPPPPRRPGTQWQWEEGVPGSAQPARGPGRGGAGRCPPPAVPFFPASPQCSAGRGHSSLREARSWELSGIAGRANRLRSRTPAVPDSEFHRGKHGVGPAGDQDRITGKPRGASTRGGGCHDRDVGKSLNPSPEGRSESRG